jgi:bifunctional NMN adenylyltransferase/nudix hydrolase
MLNKNLSVVIGRFQPLTTGHTALFAEALKDGESDLLVIIGGANVSRSAKNPFTASERAGMIRDYFTDGFEADLPDNGYWNNHKPFTVTIACVDDSDYDYEWWKTAVRECALKVARGRRVTHYGHKRNASSYYMDDALTGVGTYAEAGKLANNISATVVRKAFFEIDEATWLKYTPVCVNDFLTEFSHGDEYLKLRKEHDRIEEYKQSWKSAPYPPNHVTVDATVFWHKLIGGRGGCETATQILLIKRKDNGLWAVPGGFLNPDESLIQAAVRELYEETKRRIEVDPKLTRVFDAPDRDPRGRVITHNSAWVFGSGCHMLDPVASDDAAEARWVPLSWVRENPTLFYADHFKMINVMAQKCGILEPRIPVVLIQEVAVGKKELSSNRYCSMERDCERRARLNAEGLTKTEINHIIEEDK